MTAHTRLHILGNLARKPWAGEGVGGGGEHLILYSGHCVVWVTTATSTLLTNVFMLFGM